jgi:hypothetical protein
VDKNIIKAALTAVAWRMTIQIFEIVSQMQQFANQDGARFDL